MRLTLLSTIFCGLQAARIDNGLKEDCRQLNRREFHQQKFGRDLDSITVGLRLPGFNFDENYLILTTEYQRNFELDTPNGAIVQDEVDGRKLFYYRATTQSPGNFYMLRTFNFNLTNARPHCVRFSAAYSCPIDSDAAIGLKSAKVKWTKKMKEQGIKKWEVKGSELELHGWISDYFILPDEWSFG